MSLPRLRPAHGATLPVLAPRSAASPLAAAHVALAAARAAFLAARGGTESQRACARAYTHCVGALAAVAAIWFLEIQLSARVRADGDDEEAS